MNLDYGTDPVNWRELIKLGFVVVPIPRGQKFPIIAWRQFQYTRPSEAQYRYWFDGRASNVGIVTGKPSNIIVLDVDSEEALQQAKKFGLPKTRRVITSRGIHFYFRWPGHPVPNAVKFASVNGLDIRGDGGLVVAPPSLHPSGCFYNWAAGSLDIAEAPAWLLKRQVALNAPPARPPARRQFQMYDGTPTPYAVEVIRKQLELLMRAQPGARNDTLNSVSFQIGQHIKSGGLKEEDVRKRIHSAAVYVGLDSAEIEPTMESGLKAGMASPRDPYK